MEFENIKKAWQEEVNPALPDRPDRETIRIVKARLEKIHQTIRRRDYREIGAAAVSVIIFGAWSLTVPAMVSKLGAAIVMAGSVLIVGRLVWAHIKGGKAKPHLEMYEYCSTERDRIEAQIRLLRSTFWWYLGPNLLGTNLFVFGFTGYNAWGLGFLAVSLVLGVVLYKLNVDAARHRLAPVMNELSQLLADIEKNASTTNNISDSVVTGDSI